MKILDLPVIPDKRGNLSFSQFPEQLPFQIERTFWTYDVPGGGVRGGHAYKTQHELIIALSGSFDVVVKDRTGNERTFSMNRSYYGLYLPPLVWRHVENFSTNSLSLHLSSSKYDEQDYVRDFSEYLKIED